MAAQRADNIVVEGRKMDLFSNPLEEYWIKRKKKRPSFYPLDSCRRGYVATWEIRDNNLFLTDLDGDVEKRSLFFGKKLVKYSLKKLFPKAIRPGIKADWFSGKLRIPSGKMTQYEDTGYDSRFEKEIIITINHGEVLRTRTIDYTQRTLTVS